MIELSPAQNSFDYKYFAARQTTRKMTSIYLVRVQEKLKGLLNVSRYNRRFMVKKKRISRKNKPSTAQATPKRLRGQPRKHPPKGLTSDEKCAAIDAILRTERRPHIRKRLIALPTIYAGGTHVTAARAADASLSGVREWLHIAETKGIDALLSRAGKGRPEARYSELQTAELREAVAM